MNNLFSFTGQSPQDQTYQNGLQQYAQQGQAQINPGQAQVAASNPIQSAGMANLAQAFQKAQQQGQPSQLSMPQAQAGLQQGAAMGQPGPTPQALALARGLQFQPHLDPVGQFMNGGL